ncbi:MAG: ribonuclease BN, partial [Caldilineaceae bacterium]|nr:ribonuclease BN [Caldilineaceae bacterium]
MKRFIALVKETFKQWSADKASRLAASLSFY